MSQTSSSSIATYQVRPRFKLETTMRVDELTQKLTTALEKEEAPCQGRINSTGFGSIMLPVGQQQYWSPRLTISMEETDNGTVLRGLYGPRPAVWTLFVFFYALIALAIMVIGTIGMSRISLDKSGVILWWIPILLATFLTLYLVSYFGQKWSRDQMVTLHEFLEKSTGLEIRG